MKQLTCLLLAAALLFSFAAPAAYNPDDTATLQALIDGAISEVHGYRMGREVTLPSGALSISQTIRIHNVYGLRVNGDGCWIRWNGPPDQSAFEFAGAMRCSLRNVIIQNNWVQTTAPAIAMYNPPVGAGYQYITSQNEIENISIAHSGIPWRDGVSIDAFAGGGNGVNNEHHVFKNVSIESYRRAAVHIYASQAHQLVFRDCHFNDAEHRGQFGVYGEYGNYWSFEGGSCSYNRIADFYARDFNIRCSVRNSNHEGSRVFFVTGGPTGAGSQVDIDGVRWDGAPAPEDYVITMLTPGPLSVRNATFFATSPGWCPKCSGSGALETGPCDRCAGDGKLAETSPARLLFYPPSGTNNGVAEFANVTLGTHGGTYAPLERPIRIGEGQEVAEHGLMHRWFSPPAGYPELSRFKIAWPPDPARLRLTLPTDLQTTYQTDGQHQAVDLTGKDLLRGWSVSCTATLQPGYMHPAIWSLTDEEWGAIATLYCLNRNQWRLEGTGLLLSLTVPDVPNGAAQQLVATYDVETKAASLTVNGQTVSAPAIASLRSPKALKVGVLRQGVDYTRMDGTVEGVGLWGRALMVGEAP